MDAWLEHRQRLLQRRRCPFCAERAPARHILGGRPCPRCGEPLRLSGTSDRASEVLGAIQTGWRSARLWVYAAVLVAAFLSGWVPLLSSLVAAITMVVANFALIRRPLRWLPPVQRAMTRFASRLWFVTLILTSLALNTIAAPLIAAWGVGAFASAAVGALSTYLYIEGSLWLVSRGVARAVRAQEAR